MAFKPALGYFQDFPRISKTTRPAHLFVLDNVCIKSAICDIKMTLLQFWVLVFTNWTQTELAFAHTC